VVEAGLAKLKKVVLFLPPYSGPPLGPPVGLLSLASLLRQAGYETRIIDAAVAPQYLHALERETDDALCLGVSLLTGPMILAAIEAATRMKRLRPQLPVVFGGWHPSLLPEQTLRESYVDVVVRNQGEITFLEAVRRIEAGQSLAGLAGCSYKLNGRINHNPERPMIPLNDLRVPAYDLADFDAYERVGGGRRLPYASSVGCPYACRYCTDAVYYGRRFNALSPQRVVEEVTSLTSRYRLSEVALLDSNFLVDTRRALGIARGFRDCMPGLTWTFQASTDFLCRISDEQVRMLGQSGVTHIGFGVESASAEVLARMNKRRQTISDLFETARKCRQAGIRATFNMIYGFPGETEANRSETFEVMGRIAGRFDNVTFSPNIFTPYPGIPVWPELRQLGLKEPACLEDWAALSLGAAELPWLAGSAYRNVKRGISYFMLHDTIAHACRTSSLSRLARTSLHAIRKPLRWRLKHGRFGWPVELWLLRSREWLAAKRSLLTGESLERGPAEI
jgi:anaerobic magnesium-protoporphyrin IX monomethyl ester cyclase